LSIVSIRHESRRPTLSLFYGRQCTSANRRCRGIKAPVRRRRLRSKNSQRFTKVFLVGLKWIELNRKQPLAHSMCPHPPKRPMPQDVRHFLSREWPREPEAA